MGEVPQLSGCAAHGDSQEEALRNAQEAISLWIETAKEFGDSIPEPVGRRLVFAWRHASIMDDATSAFTAEAPQSCEFVEGSRASNTWTFAQVFLTEVLGLYQLALQLPEVVPGSRNLLEGKSHEAWATVRENLVRSLARDCYWEVFERLVSEPPERVVGLLSDDLADTWRDLKPGVEAIDGAAAGLIRDVVWHWRFSL